MASIPDALAATGQGLWRSRVAHRLLLWALLVGGIGATLVSLWEADRQHARQAARDDEALQRSVQQVLPSLTEHLWEFDDKQLRLTLGSLVQALGVTSVTLDAGEHGRWQSGEAVASAHVLRRTVEIVRQEGGRSHVLGSLTLVKDLEASRAHALHEGRVATAGQVLVVMLTALGSVLIYHRVVTRRLLAVAHRLRTLTPEDLQRAPPPPAPPPVHADELDELLASIASLQHTSHQALQRAALQHAQLRESEARHHAIISRAGDGIVVIDAASTRVLEANDAAGRMLGRSVSQLLDSTITELAPAGVSGTLARQLADAADADVIETRLQRPDGSTVDVQMRLSRMALQGRDCVLGVWRDVSADKAARQAMESAAAWHQALIQNTVEGVAIFDEAGRLIECNDRFSAMLGTRAEELMGCRPHDFDIGASPQQVERMKSLAEGDNYTFETRHRRRDGTTYDAEVSLQSARVAGRRVYVSLTRDVSARVQAREALRSREEIFRSIVDRAGDGIVMFDPVDGHFVESNEQARRQLGHAADDFSALTLFDVVAEASPGDTRAWVDRLLRGDETDVEMEQRHRDGTRRQIWASHRVVQVRGRPLVAGVWRDVTAHRAAELAVQEERRVREQLLDAIPGVAFATGADGRLTFWNRACEQLTGRTPEQLADCDVQTLFPRHRAAEVRRSLRSAFEQGGGAHDAEVQAADGSRRVYSFLSCVVSMGGQRLLVSTGIDVSARRDAERALRRLNAELETRVHRRTAELAAANARLVTTQFAMDSVGIGIHWVDPTSGCFVWVNRAAAELLDYTVEQMQRLTVPDVDPAFPLEAFARIGQRLLEEGQLRFESSQRRRDGRLVPVEVTIHHHMGDSGTPPRFIVFVTDIRQRKEQERALQRAKEAAEAANLAKSAFLANMSHEIRTPLNAITGMAHLIRREGLAPRQVDRMDKLQAAGEHLLSVIDTILELSKIEAGKFELSMQPLRVEALLGNVASMLHERAVAKGLSIVTETQDIPSGLAGDATRLQQALLNYATNAIKFTERGQVRVRAVAESEDEHGVLLRFEVSDSGIGIPPDVLPRLFSAFEQADNSTTRLHGGTGLGLAITRKIAQLMGGDAGAHSVPGQGSTFWFTARLPRAELPPASTPGQPVDAETLLRQLGAGRRVLLVEDEPVNREVATELLLDTGLQVESAHDGQQAVELARQCVYDLVLMDMQMPRLDGIGATRQIRQLPGWADTPILAMTANAFADDRRACEAAGMNDFISKPVETSVLFDRVAHWLARSAVRDLADA